MDERLKKLDSLKAKNIDPYPAESVRPVPIKDVIADFKVGKAVKLAGRITALRSHGKTIFGDIRGQADKLQFYIRKDAQEEAQLGLLADLDIGDFVALEGKLFKTRTQEKTIEVSKITLLSKSLRPLPEKWHGLRDVETRFRQRYLDLIANSRVKEIFILRSRIISEIRKFLDSRGYLEVETPLMHPIPGGAAGKPFVTHHDTLDTDLYLRIAPELYLKRLLIGGFDRVYEIGRSFRNEGISTRHNPEFTMLEVYTAYADYRDMMDLCRELITHLAEKVLGSSRLNYQGQAVDLKNWQEVSFKELMQKNFDIRPEDPDKVWVEKLRQKGKKLEGKFLSRTQCLNIIADALEPKGASPVFVTELFAELCPLAKCKKDNPQLTERFELFIGGLELANAYSELNDPREQRKRLEKQSRETKESVDEDYIQALEYGMPPAGGLGIGIDRLVMIFADAPSIREVILFPQLKPKK